MLLTKEIKPTAAGGTETSYKIPTSTVVGGSAIFSIVLVIVQAVVSIVVDRVTQAPTRRAAIRMSEEEMALVKKLVNDNFDVQLLQRILQNENQNDRNNSLKLLAAAGLLNNGDKINALMGNSPFSAPQWKPQNLDNIKDVLSGISQMKTTQQTMPAAQNTNLSLDLSSVSNGSVNNKNSANSNSTPIPLR